MTAADEYQRVIASHRVNYHQRNVGGETAATLRYTSCEGCDWLGGWHDESGWEAHVAQALAADSGVRAAVEWDYDTLAAEVSEYAEKAESEYDRAERAERALREALDSIRAAFEECFRPDMAGVDWDDDAAIQRFARKVVPYIYREDRDR